MDEVLNLALGLLAVVVAGCVISWERRQWLRDQAYRKGLLHD